MKELFKVMRLAFYVCAFPLVATATVSAFQYLENKDEPEISRTETSSALQDKQPTYIVRRTADGVVSGRVVDIDPSTAKITGIANLSIQFAQNGNLVAKTTTDDQGNFAVGDMDAGTYSFFGISNDAFVSFATKIVEDSEQNASFSLFVETSATTGMVDKLTRELNLRKQDNKLSALTQEDRQEFVNLKGGSRVQLTDDGKLVGRAVSLYREGNDRLEGTEIQLYQAGKLVDETKTDAKGNYVFYNIEDGVYDLVAVGKGGFAAFRFDAARLTQDASIVETVNSTRSELARSALAPVQEFALTPFNDAVFAQDTVTPIPQDQSPILEEGPPVFMNDGFGGFAPGPGFGDGGLLRRLLVIPIIIAGGGGGGSTPGPVSPNQ